MTEIIKARNERNRILNRLKNKKLVTILNHKMFKGYRDIKASKWFFNQKPKYISQLAWEDKIFDPFDDLYNLNYKMNVLYPLKNPSFNNIMFIKNYPPKEKKIAKQELKNNNRAKTTINSFSSSDKNLSTIDSRNNKKKFYDKKNNFYLTSMSIYQTDNFYHDINPSKVYKQIFENDKVIYNDIPILSLDKIQKYNNKTKLKKNTKNTKKAKNSKNKNQIKYVNNTKNEIIQTNNIKDDIYNGLTEKQFLYKISHNKSNKSIDDKININAFRKNKGVVKGFVSKRLNSAQPIQFKGLGLPTLNKKKTPKGVTIELEYDNSGNMKTTKLFTTNEDNLVEEIINGTNNYLIYNSGNNIGIDKNNNKTQSRARSSIYRESDTEGSIFGNTFTKIKKKNINIEPPIRYFENKPRIFDDKLLLQLQLDKRNQFLKLKQLME